MQYMDDPKQQMEDVDQNAQAEKEQIANDEAEKIQQQADEDIEQVKNDAQQ